MKPQQTPTPRGWTGGNKDFEVHAKCEGHVEGHIGWQSEVSFGDADEAYDMDQGPGS